MDLKVYIEIFDFEFTFQNRRVMSEQDKEICHDEIEISIDSAEEVEDRIIPKPTT